MPHGVEYLTLDGARLRHWGSAGVAYDNSVSGRTDATRDWAERVRDRPVIVARFVIYVRAPAGAREDGDAAPGAPRP